MHITYQRSMEHNYMVIEDENLSGEEYTLHMLEQVAPPSFLKLQIRRMNGKVSLFYEITSLQPLTRIYERIGISGDDIMSILACMEDCLQEAEKYLLDPSDILLEPDLIYRGIDSGKLSFCLLPGSGGEGGNTLTALAEFILKRLDHEDTKAVELGYLFYELVSTESFHFSGIIDELRSCASRFAPSSADGSSRAAGPAGSAGTAGTVGAIGEARFSGRGRSADSSAPAGGISSGSGGFSDFSDPALSSVAHGTAGPAFTAGSFSSPGFFSSRVSGGVSGNAAANAYSGDSRSALFSDSASSGFSQGTEAGSLLLHPDRPSHFPAGSSQGRKKKLPIFLVVMLSLIPVEILGAGAAVWLLRLDLQQIGAVCFALIAVNWLVYNIWSSHRQKNRNLWTDELEEMELQDEEDAFLEALTREEENPYPDAQAQASGSFASLRGMTGPDAQGAYEAAGFGQSCPDQNGSMDYPGYGRGSRDGIGAGGDHWHKPNRDISAEKEPFGDSYREENRFDGYDEKDGRAGGSQRRRGLFHVGHDSAGASLPSYAAGQTPAGEPWMRGASLGWGKIPGQNLNAPQTSEYQSAGQTRYLGEMQTKERLCLVSEDPRRSRDLLIETKQAVIGKRAGQADLLIPLDVISRVHARIEQKEDAWYITDLNSTNGTFVNGERLSPNETRQISADDRVSFATVHFRARIRDY